MSRYDIRIEQLVLRGVDEVRSADIVALVEERLRSLASATPVGDLRDGAADALRTRPVTGDDRTLGADIADRIWSAVSSAQGGGQ